MFIIARKAGARARGVPFWAALVTVRQYQFNETDIGRQLGTRADELSC